MTYLQLLLMKYIEDQSEPKEGVFLKDGYVEIRTNKMYMKMTEDMFYSLMKHPKLREIYNEI